MDSCVGVPADRIVQLVDPCAWIVQLVDSRVGVLADRIVQLLDSYCHSRIAQLVDSCVGVPADRIVQLVDPCAWIVLLVDSRVGVPRILPFPWQLGVPAAGCCCARAGLAARFCPPPSPPLRLPK